VCSKVWFIETQRPGIGPFLANAKLGSLHNPS
jgi:hypothetical protein